MTNKKLKVDNVPNLRFPGFESEWETKKLGEIGEIVNGLTYSPNDIAENGVLVLRSSNVQNRILAFEDNVYVRTDNYNPVQESDILICVRNGSKNLIGKNALINKENEGIAFGAFMSIYRSVFNKFLFHWFDTREYKEVVHKNLGATINSINGSDLKLFKVPFPSVEEQQKIASFLFLIDERIQTQSKIIEQLETLIRESRSKIFNQKLRFPDFKYNWKKVNFRDIATFYSGGTPLTSKKEYFDGNIPFIRSGEINSDQTEQFITDLGLKNSSAKMVDVGDILYALYGATSGEVGISKIKGAINQAVLCIKSTENHYFLYSYLVYKKESIIKTFLQGGQGNLSADIVKQLKINLTSLEEQNRIVSFLSKIDQKIEIEKSVLQQLEKQKKYLLQQMFV